MCLQARLPIEPTRQELLRTAQRGMGCCRRLLVIEVWSDVERIESCPSSLKDKEIDFVQPGAAANLTWVSASGAFAFDLQGEVNQVIDQVVARWHVIHEVGTNKELKGKDSFGALGSDSGLKISFPSENTLLAALE